MKHKRTRAICDRCGGDYRLNQLRNQVVARRLTSLMVCPPCLDQDQPQWVPAKFRTDPEPVRDVRPDTGIEEANAGFGWNPVGGFGTILTCGIPYIFDLLDVITPPLASGPSVMVQQDLFPFTTEADFSLITET